MADRQFRLLRPLDLVERLQFGRPLALEVFQFAMELLDGQAG